MNEQVSHLPLEPRSFLRLRDIDDTQPYDLIVVGGGITGAGILREAARSGYRSLLVEQRDFAWGTSSRSSKMVHGGIRYLAMGDVKLTRHSLQERERLLAEAPGLVDRMGYYYTLARRQRLPAFAVRLVLWLYDRLAGIKDHRSVRLAALRRVFPGLETDLFKASFYYTDAVTNDARLVMRVLQEALQASDRVFASNYAKVQRLWFDDAGHQQGVEVVDEATGEATRLRAGVVINATGAWADRLRNQINPERRVRPLRGSHLVFSRRRLEVSHAITLSHPDDGRTLFIYPWEGRTVVGTTDLDHTLDLDVESSIEAQEVTYLLRAANALFPAATLTRRDVISSWSGVRPIIGADGARDPSQERRDHAVWVDGRLITVSGGKLTTFRLIAKDALKAASQYLPPQSTSGSSERIFAQLAENVSSSGVRFNPQHWHQLNGRYGSLLDRYLRQANRDELQAIDETCWSLADCRWACRYEAVRHLDDLLLRRTHLGALLPDGAQQVLPQLRSICLQELDWSDAQWDAEVERYLEIYRAHYSLPDEGIK